MHQKHLKLELKEYYDPGKYPRYDNYDAINISKVFEIPKDYEGTMGVPLTYLKYYDKKFLYKMKGYKTIEKEVNSGMLFGEKLFRVLGDILIPYTIERRLSSSLADELLEKLLQQLVMMEEMGMGSINKEKVEEGFKQLDNELPRWK